MRPEPQRSQRCRQRLQRRWLLKYRKISLRPGPDAEDRLDRSKEQRQYPGSAQSVMILELNGFELKLALRALLYGQWVTLTLGRIDRGYSAELFGLRVKLLFDAPKNNQIDYLLTLSAPFATRVRCSATVPGQRELFHVIPGNIHGDNNAAHVRAGEFPCLNASRADRNCSPL